MQRMLLRHRLLRVQDGTTTPFLNLYERYLFGRALATSRICNGRLVEPARPPLTNPPPGYFGHLAARADARPAESALM